MLDYIQESDSIQLIAPAGGITGGQLYKQGSMVGVTVSDQDEGEMFVLMLEGAFDNVPKKAGESWNIGDMLYYETSSGDLTTSFGGNTWAGYAFYAATAEVRTGAILLKQ